MRRDGLRLGSRLRYVHGPVRLMRISCSMPAWRSSLLLHPSTTEALDAYLAIRRAQATPDDHLFVLDRGRMPGPDAVPRVFRKLAIQTGIRTGTRRPRVHDLRTRDRLAPVLPIVLYTGESRWRTAVRVIDLVTPGAPAPYETRAHAWKEEYRAAGRVEGRKEDKEEGRRESLRRYAEMKFDVETAAGLGELLDGVADREMFDNALAAVFESDTSAEMLRRVTCSGAPSARESDNDSGRSTYP